MGKFSEKRKANKQEKRANTYGVNPVTGVALSKKQFNIVKKRGLSESGLVMGKKEAQLEYGNVGTRRGRTAMREGVRTTRSENGNTFGESMAKAVGSVASAFGGNAPDEFEEETNYKSTIGESDPYFENQGSGVDYVNVLDEAVVTRTKSEEDNKQKPSLLMIGGIIGIIAVVVLVVMKMGKKKTTRRR